SDVRLVPIHFLQLLTHDSLGLLVCTLSHFGTVVGRACRHLPKEFLSQWLRTEVPRLPNRLEFRRRLFRAASLQARFKFFPTRGVILSNTAFAEQSVDSQPRRPLPRRSQIGR